ncbi:phosphoglycerate dehydrogenase [Amycolatopsis mediterranei S699]|uniref:Phosphoglycerate dehydrogenase n=2 Tax=Amycolatopsis mediterranei TaxID=33910 RepID=A0A0H3DHA4_AMYMU|nr:D-2-hydroxyacid dehydrogenase [Amycolatopsis mediterranei]ADJ49577.1 phosphoglycerate dehydrogenase [Amycolatopsis mediterranei U32]AEK46557.1 phosphoglycerate dehydrogenase [Amycolatopsis mediterranei S699]AFO81286.1 phosphoglycerate dehydrogenase [Amycolatopsis mediterranei S699]AGT88414.1 phosphoglycerate dehydrogenase [Amycolatopsis mediterranei RB]KDO12791.1 2-hydroxyacid dehydrogenase [Amycolatopsis mediterranei]
MIASEHREAPVLAVLCGESRPPDMRAVESGAVVLYTDAAGLAEALPGADALFVYDFLSTAVPGAWHAADRLRWLHIASAGVDPVLFPGLRESDVVLTNSRGVFDDAIAEYVLGVVLAFAKDFARSHDLQREGRWLHRESERIAGREVVVVGTGPIGRAIARLLRAAGMRVSGAGRRERIGDPDFGVVHESARLTEFLPHADYVVAVAPLTEHTKGMFDARAFAAMKPSARFVNVGRGELVVTSDLVAALESKTIAGAALDVFDTEPLPAESPLWTLPDVLISPHMSGDFVGWRNTLVEVFTENFRRWRTGEPLRNVVDKTLGYVPSGNQGAG